MAAGIDLENICVSRGAFMLRNITLSIKPGEMFGILGRTGSGKTVLFETIAGACQPLSGTLSIGGVDARQLGVRDRSLGMVYQDYMLFPHLSAYENIAYGLRRAHLDHASIEEHVSTMLERFGIAYARNRRPGLLSGGEAQRCALARALVTRPEILLLDEPFSALDPTTKRGLYGLLRQVHEEFGCTIVFVTHDFHEAQELAERVGILVDGELLAVCGASELFTREFDRRVMAFLGRTEQADAQTDNAGGYPATPAAGHPGGMAPENMEETQ